MKRKSVRSEIHWSYFHLSPLHGVFLTLPVPPSHTITARNGILMTIDTIQVRFLTVIVPPGAVILLGAVFVLSVIIILISSGK